MGGVRWLLLLLAVCGTRLSWALPPLVSADDGDVASNIVPAADDGAASQVATAVPAVLGVPLANGWFFPGAADSASGVAILDEPNGPPFWSSYQQLGGTGAL